MRSQNVRSLGVFQSVLQNLTSVGVEGARILSRMAVMKYHNSLFIICRIDSATNCMVADGLAREISAGQSIGKRWTQWTMRSVHMGCAASRILKASNSRVKTDAIIQQEGLRLIHTGDGASIGFNQNGHSVLFGKKSREMERYRIVRGRAWLHNDRLFLQIDELLTAWNLHRVLIIAELSRGTKFEDIISGIPSQRHVDQSTGHLPIAIVRQTVELHPTIESVSRK
jgi:DNA-directed RNA polymerase subunit beta'